MYNFLDPKLFPKVDSPTSCLDHYEVTNLIDSDIYARSHGFIAYNIIKPPVDVIFELLCSVDVRYVVVSTTVGTQKCTAIELACQQAETPFQSVCKAYFDNSGVVFCDSHFYSKSNPPPGINPDYHLAFFKSNERRLLASTSSLKVTILRTFNNKVPCLARVQVWGKVSRKCSFTTANTVERLMRGAVRGDTSETVTRENDSSPIEDDFVVPDEFKDQLTFEILTVPLTLPSGNTIDQTTLEKYIANETVYGRPPSDPFTNQPFTNGRKPVLNVALKSRIDLFLFQNCDKKETFSLKRTLGNASSHSIALNVVKLLKGDAGEVEIKNVDASVESCGESLKRGLSDEDSLEEAIKRAKSSVNFICFDNKKDDPLQIQCTSCQSARCLYVIPCKHLFCRTCIFDVCKDHVCTNCSQQFTKSDVKRFYS